MTDVTAPLAKRDAAGHRPQDLPPAAPATEAEQRLIAMVELLFFAYRDFTAEPDAILDEMGFGRAHHRVLHFVNRNPGLRVADLLHVLRITKQSLARVLKQLIDDGFITQTTGPKDRRERRLHATEAGHRLAERLLTNQTRRIAAALQAAGPGAETHAEAFLLGVISAEDRDAVRRLTGPRRLSKPSQGSGDR
ncbi:MAG: MarR family winged helix-turn-helix transcriptional regulator [Hyphomicrobiaceae bacterium]